MSSFTGEDQLVCLQLTVAEIRVTIAQRAILSALLIEVERVIAVHALIKAGERVEKTKPDSSTGRRVSPKMFTCYEVGRYALQRGYVVLG